jgi:hypothetical protein
MKNANESAHPKMISTPTIVVLVIGVALIAYMFIQPLLAPKGQLPPATRDAANPANQGAAKTTGAAGKPQPTAVAANDRASVQPGVGAGSPGKANLATDAALTKNSRVELISDRDPFVPSGVIARAAAAKTETVIPAVAPTRPPQVAAVIAKAPPLVRFAWKGVVGGFGPRQVVLIQHNARTYILHQGDPVPGTKYIVAEVTTETVLLTSPSDQLRLSKKKEAKVNG